MALFSMVCFKAFDCHLSCVLKDVFAFSCATSFFLKKKSLIRKQLLQYGGYIPVCDS